MMASPLRAIRWLLAAALVTALAASAAQAGDDIEGMGLMCAAGPCGVADYDGDFIKDFADNCPLNGNPKQQDNDKDTPAPIVDAGKPPEPVGTTTGPLRIYPTTPYQSGQVFPTDIPKEQGGDACDVDDDNDGVYDRRAPGHKGPDNCKMIANPDQADADHDSLGDACDKDFNGPAAATIAAVSHPKRLKPRRYDEVGAGLIVPLHCSAACSLSGSLTAGKTLIGRGTASLAGAGQTYLIVRIPTKSLHNLARKVKRLRGQLTVTTVGEPTARTVMSARVVLHR